MPRFKLLVSPVVPPLRTQVGAEVDPSASTIVTMIDEPLLKLAREPLPFPTTLNSDSLQTEEISSTLSLAVIEYVLLPLANTTESFPPGDAVPSSALQPRRKVSSFEFTDSLGCKPTMPDRRSRLGILMAVGGCRSADVATSACFAHEATKSVNGC